MSAKPKAPHSTFAERELQRAAEGVAPEEMLDRIPPRSEGLTSLPYWTPGVKIPGPEAMGAVIGFRDVHTRAHVYRCLLKDNRCRIRLAKPGCLTPL